MISLYVKTHRKTGLKYLGITSRDPFSYSGSGKIWKHHIKKYGNDVVTIVVRWCKDNQSARFWGIFYSNLWNVVSDSSWANIRREEGTGGCQRGAEYARRGGNISKTTGIGIHSRNKEVQREMRVRAASTKKILGKIKIDQLNSEEAILKRKETYIKNKHQQGSKNSQYGSRWVTNEFYNMRLPSHVSTPIGWKNGRKMGLSSIPQELKEFFILEAT